MKKLLLFVLLPLVLILVLVQALGGMGSSQDQQRTVAVVRGSVVREAVAVGRIEANFEIPVKSSSGGVLTQSFVALGQWVNQDDPLVEVRPVLTDLQRLQAERALLGASEAEESVLEFQQGENLLGKFMWMMQGSKSLDRMGRGAARARSDAEEQLELLLNGHAEIDGKVIDYIVRAPISGNVIDLSGEVGQPVVPSSSFGSGTQLLVLADLRHPVFRGSVDEIDVGRLREGMSVTLTIGALPGVLVNGKLREISLRAQSRNNAVVFEVEIDVEPPPELVLRSGFSAVARVRIDEAIDVLTLPERVVDFRAEGAFVRILDEDGKRVEIEIETGLSDGLVVEIRSGLSDGQEVFEGRP